MQSLETNILFNWITIERLLEGLYFTLEVSFTAILLSGLLGTLFGIIRTSNKLGVRIIFRTYLETVRVLPTLVLLYILYYTLPSILNLNIDGRLVGIIAFTFWGAAEMSDIIRSAIISLPKHQTESALAIGLNKTQLFCYVLLPQALKLAIPPAINLAARIIMTTSLLVLISVQDITKVGKEIIEYASMMGDDMAPFWIYGFILLVFFAICYPLSKLSQRLTRRKD